MEHGFEEFQVGGRAFTVAKHVLSDCGAVEGAIGGEDAGTEMGKERSADRWIARWHFQPCPIGIEQAGTQLDEHLSGDRLAASNAADEADGFHTESVGSCPIVAALCIDFEWHAK